jgi:NADH:ubiquinone oxidoreductase subunit C
MTNQEKIRETLYKQFNYLQDHVTILKNGRMAVDIDQKNLHEILLFNLKLLDFNFICTITGLDDGENLSFIYHLINTTGVMFNIKIRAPKAKPVIPTITDIFPSADIYERELIDLLGVEVEGLPPGIKYPLPDDWPAGQYPLRKEWKVPDSTTADPAQEGGTNAP